MSLLKKVSFGCAREGIFFLKHWLSEVELQNKLKKFKILDFHITTMQAYCVYVEVYHIKSLKKLMQYEHSGRFDPGWGSKTFF